MNSNTNTQRYPLRRTAAAGAQQSGRNVQPGELSAHSEMPDNTAPRGRAGSQPRVAHLPQLLDWPKKAIDLYEFLGRNLDVGFCQYHLAQLLPPAKAIDLYSQAIYQFSCSSFTHHRERGKLDQCYSLMEAEKYSEAISMLEVLQHRIGYCGEIFQLRCKELLVERHCWLNARRPALQAVRETIKAMEESDAVRNCRSTSSY